MHSTAQAATITSATGLARLCGAAALSIVFVALPAGCRSGARNFSNDNDVLRAQVLELEKQLDELKHRNAELETELRQSSVAPDSLPEEVRAAMPHPVELQIDRLSHAQDSNDDGAPDALVIYVRPADGMGRFTQLVGHLAVNAAVLPAGADAVTIGRASLDPIELRTAYRAGLTGTHYTVQVPIALPQGLDASSPGAEATVRVIFTDGLTGQTRAAERAISLSRMRDATSRDATARSAK